MDDTPQHDLPTEALIALQSGRRIEAIRIVREELGLGLKEAKARVEAAERGRGFAPSDGVGAKINAREDSGMLRLVVVLVVLAALAGYVMF